MKGESIPSQDVGTNPSRSGLHLWSHQLDQSHLGIYLPPRVQGIIVSDTWYPIGERGSPNTHRLEQIDFLFQNHIPARKSRRWVLDHFQDALARDVEGNILEKEGVAGITTEEVKTAEDRDDLQGRHSVPTFA